MIPRAFCRIAAAAFIALLAVSPIPAAAQATGSLNHNGTEMPVKGVVAVWDAKKPALLFHLLPFQPTPDEVALLQKNDTIWLSDKKSVDEKKWPGWVPRASVSLSWSFEKEAVGELNKSWTHLYAFGIGEQNSNLNFNFASDELHGTLTGKVKEGEQVTLAAKGQGTLGNNKLSWDFKVKAKVLPALAQ